MKEGILLACEKQITSKLLKPHSNRYIHIVDLCAGVLSVGLQADARHLANRAREEAASYRESFEVDIPPHVLAERLSLYIQAHTMYSSVRPFGAISLLAVKDKLYLLDPSGSYYNLRATAIGKGRQTARTELENLSFEKMSLKEAITCASKILKTCREEGSLKHHELEMSFISISSLQHHHLSPEQISEAEAS